MDSPLKLVRRFISLLPSEREEVGLSLMYLFEQTNRYRQTDVGDGQHDAFLERAGDSSGSEEYREVVSLLRTELLRHPSDTSTILWYLGKMDPLYGFELVVEMLARPDLSEEEIYQALIAADNHLELFNLARTQQIDPIMLQRLKDAVLRLERNYDKISSRLKAVKMRLIEAD